MRFILLLLLPFYGFSQSSGSYKIKELNLDSIFKDHPGTFVLWNPVKNEYLVHDKARSQKSFPPHSTSKIVLSIIALEDTIVKSERDSMKWDSIAHPRDWWTDKSFDAWVLPQNIVSGLKHSVNWYYMELVWRMNQQKIKDGFKKYEFATLPDSLGHHYFHYVTLSRTTAINQVNFLEKLYSNRINISKKTREIILKGMIQKDNPNYKLYSKTGGGSADAEGSNALGWTIGMVQKGKQIYYFATNVEGKDFDEIKDLRNEISWQALKALKIIGE